MKNELTQEYLKSILHYDEISGDFIWLINNKRNKAESIAGFILKSRNNSYRAIRINGKRYRHHHLTWLYMTGSFPKDQIDHQDHNGLNNAWLNLKEATQFENHKNKRRFKNNKTGITGVQFVKNVNKWKARIRSDGKEFSLGSYKDFFEACCIRKSAEIKHKFHPNHGSN